MRHRSALLAARLILLLGCLTVRILPAQVPGPVRSEQELRFFYHRACARCHGEDGSAFSPDGRKLKGLDFTSGQGMSGASDQALVKTIQNGIYFGMSMPAFKRELTDDEALLLVRSILRKARKGESIHADAQASEPKRARLVPPIGIK